MYDKEVETCGKGEGGRVWVSGRGYRGGGPSGGTRRGVSVSYSYRNRVKTGFPESPSHSRTGWGRTPAPESLQIRSPRVGSWVPYGLLTYVRERWVRVVYEGQTRVTTRDWTTTRTFFAGPGARPGAPTGAGTVGRRATSSLPSEAHVSSTRRGSPSCR